MGGLVGAVVGSGSEAGVVIAAGLHEAGAPDFALNLVGPGGVKQALAQRVGGGRAALLQALRWRVLRRPEAAQAEAVGEYVEADVLDLRGGDAVVQWLLGNEEAEVREQSARLVECLSRVVAGRRYLMSSRAALLPHVVSALKASPNPGSHP